MGSDGGTKLRRSDLVKNQSGKTSENEFIKQNNSKIFKIRHCSICNKGYTSDDSIVGDYIGSLYHKECVLEKLINREIILEALLKNEYVKTADGLDNSNLKSLKDFKEIKSLTCPITKKSLIMNEDNHKSNKNSNFFYFADCGCSIFSEEVLENNLIKFKKDAVIAKKLEKLSNEGSDCNVDEDNDIKNVEDYIIEGDSICINCNSKICKFNKIEVLSALTAEDNRNEKRKYTDLKNRIRLLNKLGFSHNLSKIKGKTKKSMKKKNKIHKLEKEENKKDAQDKSKKRIKV